MKFSTPFVFAAGASAQFYGGYPTFRNPYNNFAATRSFGFGYGNNPWQSRWNAPATMTANTAPVMTNTDKADAWISAFDSGDSEAAASFMQPGMTFTVNGAPVGLDLSDPAVVAGLPKHTHSDRYYTAQDDDVVMTLTANFDDKPSNVEFLRLHFNSMGKIDSIVNVSPVPPECGEETSAGMTADTCSATAQALEETVLQTVSLGGEFDLSASHGAHITFGTSKGEAASVTVSAPAASDRPIDENTLLTPIYSATKMVTGITFLRLVEEGILELDKPLGKYIDWWTQKKKDPRSKVTLRHLLSQTSGFGAHPDDALVFPGMSCELSALMGNSEITQEQCTRQIYERAFGHITAGLLANYEGLDPDDVSPGSHFFYAESHFTIAVFLAEHVTGERIHDIFRKYVADDLGLDESCNYMPGALNVDGGAMLFCSSADLSKLLTALLNGSLLPQALMDEMEKAQTLDSTVDSRLSAIYPDGVTAHYGLGAWRLCREADCSDPALMHSIGAEGVLPWWERKAGASGDTDVWGLVARDGGRFAEGVYGMDATMAAWPFLLKAFADSGVIEACG